MDRSPPGYSVLHRLPELAQTHASRISNAREKRATGILLSKELLSPLNLGGTSLET